MMQASSANVLVASVAVNTNVVSDVTSTCAAKGLNGKDIPFFHSLIGGRLDEGDLFVAVDLVAKDIVASDVVDGLDGDSLSVQSQLVGLHDFLDASADVVYASIDAGFLYGCVSGAEGVYGGVLTLSPVLVAALTASSRLSYTGL